MAIKPIDHYSITNLKPSVYDEESMTALELVGRIGQKLNEAIAAYNELETNTDEKLAAYNEFINTMNEITMPSKVRDEVEAHIARGDFDRAINTYLGDLETRLNNIFANVTEGTSTLDAEIIDGRSNEKTSYLSIGECLRNETEIMRLSARVNYLLMKNGYVKFDLNKFYVNRALKDSYQPSNETPIRLTMYSLFEIPRGSVCYMHSDHTKFRYGCYWYDENYNYIGMKETTMVDQIPMSENKDTRFIRVVATNIDNVQPISIAEFSECTYFTVEKIDTEIKPVTYTRSESKNLYDRSKRVSGYLGDTGSIIESTSYFTSGFIPCKKGETFAFSPGIRKMHEYNEDKNRVYIVDQPDNTEYVYTATTDGFIRASVRSSDESIFQIEKNDAPTDFEEGINTFSEFIHMSSTMKNDVVNMFNDGSNGNVLYGKKYVACGDSFTAGDFSGATDETTFKTGIYSGMKKVYPYFIGNRNNMTVINEAIGGSTLTYGGANALSGDRLHAIPLDADYITIKIGINDGSSHQNMPLGTINDTVNTTFYGAWNTVLEYLITNAPYAKIGIIVSNGMDDKTFADATIAVCKKWGIAYLDLATGENEPLMLRSLRTDVSSKAKSLRNAAFRVSDTNSHPNVKSHEYESYIIEDFLRRL